MNENINKLIIFSGGILIGYIIGKKETCSKCQDKNYIIKQLKSPAYCRDFPFYY